MSKLPALKSREVARILKRAGFNFVRQKGSHCLYRKDEVSIVVPWHSKDLRTGTLRKIISCSGLAIEEFLELR